MSLSGEARRYHALKHQLFFIGFFIDLSLLVFFFFSGLTFVCKAAALTVSSSPFAVNAVYVLLLSAAAYLIHFPLNYFEEFHWEHKFKLSNQSFGQWLKDDIKRSLLGLIIVLILIEAVYWFLGRFPSSWWIWAGAFWLFVMFFLARITPNFIVPMFYKYIPVQDQKLREKIFTLFKKSKVALQDVYAIDLSVKTKKANAFLCGLGQSRRVVLSDTLLEQFTPDEIEVVVAHELGHYQHRDIFKLLIVNGLTIFAGLFLIDKGIKNILLDRGVGLEDISGLPVLAAAFMVFGFIITPLSNWYSCRVETDADRFSLVTTGKREEFMAMMEKLGKMNLAEFSPGRLVEIFFYDHPPVAKRIAFAKQFNLGS